jgi:hypothetical protein
LFNKWKDKIQKVQNTALRKILGGFKSAPIKGIKRDAEILSGTIQIKQIRDQSAVRKTRYETRKSQQASKA